VSVGVTAPIGNSGTATAPVINIAPATDLTAGSMSAADKASLDTLTTVQPSPVKWNLLGDSLTVGPGNSGYEDSPGGYREELQRLLGLRRGDVRFIGSSLTLAIRAAGDPVPAVALASGGQCSVAMLYNQHDGHSGFTIVQMTAGYPGWAATMGSADAVTVLAGTNDAAGGASAATMLANYALLLAAVRTAQPTATIFACTIPPYVSPAAGFALVGAVVGTFNAGLAALVASLGDPKIVFVDACAGFAAWATYSDGIHMAATAAALFARRLLDAFQRAFTEAFFLLQGELWPMSLRPREQISLSGTATDTPNSSLATDGLRWPTDANLQPNGVSWFAAVWWKPVAVNTVSFTSILTSGNALKISLGHIGQTLKLYVNGSLASTFPVSPASVIRAGQAHRVVLFYDFIQQVYCVFINGVLCGIFASAFSAPNNSAWYVGSEPSIVNGSIGAYKRFHFGAGAVPTLHTTVDGFTIEEAVRRDYIDQIAIPGRTFASEANDGAGGGFSVDRGFTGPIGLEENVTTQVGPGGWTWVATVWPWLRDV
jgi:hypothetical protein